ncbi:uncharacterized protein LOC110695023 [Chenopodium quinoa]|uniref:uncharacterized protein LOC110695023 n=1 Tax=Chenopodium quinoa TaxID=63459 RepID=UPI000B783061|nr:uncharacterized protein LOC110695023 [Chenopodium quinoa]
MDTVDLKITVGGAFIPSLAGKNRRVLTWDGGWVYWMRKVEKNKIDVHFLRQAAIHGFVYVNVKVPRGFSCWYKQKGKSWVNGKRELVDGEVNGFLESVNKEGACEMYVTSHEPIEGTNKTPFKCIAGNELTPAQRKELKKRFGGPKVYKPSPELSKPTEEEPFRKIPRLKGIVIHDREAEERLPRAEKVNANTHKGKGKLTAADKGKAKVGDETGNFANLVRKIKERVRSLSDVSDVFTDEDGDTESSDSELSNFELEVDEGEEDLYSDDDEQWLKKNLDHINSEVKGSLRGVTEGGDQSDDEDTGFDIKRNLQKIEVRVEEEAACDSDELKSVEGDSDDDQGSVTWFNPETDFERAIKFVVGKRFSYVQTMRKALRQHAIENRYEYYLLHNDSKRLTAYCKRKCKCVYNKNSCRIVKCTCSKGVRCRFKFYEKRLVKSEAWQIKTLRLKHRCVRSKMNNKVTAEFLADRYLEEFRGNPRWKIKQIQDRALNDLGIKITYSKAWLARSRVKLIIYGSSSEQYSKVWDYGKALLKWNPGSECNVVVDDINQIERPIFMRMFVCLAALRDGFISGCRPVIGVDGCHLKGAYPGKILVAVGKDGNNAIFPIAWATAEIENKDNWCWFLESLLKALCVYDQGDGLTFMSDRQKGLIEAFADVAPKAELRFCVRHIWSNFKLKFHGATFKELFWAAARASTLFEFEVAMESINFLDEEAYQWLSNIDPQHWSRHAFSTNCKSNMLLNNMCETFNAVIRDARDKPILTQMEWLRRYMTKRSNDKWEAAKSWEGLLTPFVNKVFDGLEKYAMTCEVTASRDEIYEVKYKDD